jgi:hypothetical protein
LPQVANGGAANSPCDGLVRTGRINSSAICLCSLLENCVYCKTRMLPHKHWRHHRVRPGCRRDGRTSATLSSLETRTFPYTGKGAVTPASCGFISKRGIGGFTTINSILF